LAWLRDGRSAQSHRRLLVVVDLDLRDGVVANSESAAVTPAFTPPATSPRASRTPTSSASEPGTLTNRSYPTTAATAVTRRTTANLPSCVNALG
jgi:hypothetical protein